MAVARICRVQRFLFSTSELRGSVIESANPANKYLIENIRFGRAALPSVANENCEHSIYNCARDRCHREIGHFGMLLRTSMRAFWHEAKGVAVLALHTREGLFQMAQIF